MCTENWRKNLYERAKREYDGYIEGLKNRPFEEIEVCAFEMAAKQDILEMFRANAAETALLGLRDVEKPLETVYQEWFEEDEKQKKLLQQSIEHCSYQILRKEAEEYYKNPQAPLYRKNLIDAKKSGEIHLWRGDKNRNEECLAYFDKNIRGGYENGRLSPFLQGWVKEFGFERCKTLLAAVVMKAAYDKRYSKEVKENAAFVGMPNIAYEDFYSNVHPVIINSAYQTLMEMERGRDSPKGKGGGKPQKAESRKRTEPER